MEWTKELFLLTLKADFRFLHHLTATKCSFLVRRRIVEELHRYGVLSQAKSLGLTDPYIGLHLGSLHISIPPQRRCLINLCRDDEDEAHQDPPCSLADLLGHR